MNGIPFIFLPYRSRSMKNSIKIVYMGGVPTYEKG